MRTYAYTLLITDWNDLQEYRYQWDGKRILYILVDKSRLILLPSC